MDFTASYLMEDVTLSGSTYLTEGGNKSFIISAEFSFGLVSKNQWSMNGQ